MLNYSFNFSMVMRKIGFYFFSLSSFLPQQKVDLKLKKLIQKQNISKIKNFIDMGLNKNMLSDWSHTSCEIVENFMQDSPEDNKQLIDSLIKAQRFDKDFFRQYLFVQKERCWIDTLINFPYASTSQNRKSYNYLINHEDISNNVKAAIDLKLLENLLDNPSFKFSSSFHDERVSLASVLSEVSSIIDNGYIFKNKISAFRSLLWIFSNNMITEHLPAKKLHTCLDNFSELTVMAKKVIFKNLIKKKQETIILNLFNRGIDLNWMIDFEGNGQAEVCSLKILENLKLSDVLLSTMEWNMLAKNSTGDNILHIMCGSSLLDGNLPKLNIKISFLTPEDKYAFLNEQNDKGLTPLAQAILLRDEDMVDFLIENGVKKWSTCEDNPLEFLEDCINGDNNCLLPESLQHSDLDTDFWHHLLKDWESEKLYIELEGKLGAKKIKEKAIKI
jgi:ankyrin repeat protein